MSVQRRGDGWRVRCREGGQQPSRQFARKSDAQAFEREIKRRQALGPLTATVLVSSTTLTDFVRAEWWPKYAVANLKPSTLPPLRGGVVGLPAGPTWRLSPR